MFRNSLVIWVKLTQGTGRGTCWWNIYKIFFFFLAITCYFKMMTLNFLDWFNYFNFLSWEDLFVFFFLYNFFKFLILNSVMELIWPTLYFNRKHSIGFKAYRLRTYTETILKLRSSSKTFSMFTKLLVKYFI